MSIVPHQTRGRRVTVLGSTGSIGVNTLGVLEAAEESFSVFALTARSNVKLLAEQAKRVKPERVVIADEALFDALKQALSGTGIAVYAGEDAVAEAAAEPVDWLMSAIVGAAGLKPTLAAIRRGGVVALANKECLVCAGELMMEEVRRCGATLIPVDSEHSAIAQSMVGNKPEHIRHITLTASGGPFRTWSLDAIQAAKPEQALKHPNWDMGAKITIDSATMMNKGLELIEAYHLFPVTLEQIQVVVHPESIVHGMVQYKDGSVIAQLGEPDMMTPIAVSLAWPSRMSLPKDPLDLIQCGKLTFEAVDDKRFPAVKLAREVVAQGGAAPIIMNAANEIAVEAFLKGQIGFANIVSVVQRILADCQLPKPESLDDVLEIDKAARRFSREYLRTHMKKAA